MANKIITILLLAFVFPDVANGQFCGLAFLFQNADKQDTVKIELACHDGFPYYYEMKGDSFIVRHVFPGGKENIKNENTDCIIKFIYFPSFSVVRSKEDLRRSLYMMADKDIDRISIYSKYGILVINSPERIYQFLYDNTVRATRPRINYAVNIKVNKCNMRKWKRKYENVDPVSE